MIVEHLKQRHVDLSVHHPIFDIEENVATFLLYNLSGQIVGYQQYRPLADKSKSNDPRSGRYYTYHSKNMTAVFGIETLHFTSDVLFITEGIFDAVRLTKYKVSVIATLSNNPGIQVRNFISCLGRKTIAICDNDRAGKMLSTYADYSIIMEDKDLGDSSEETVLRILNGMDQKYLNV